MRRPRDHVHLPIAEWIEPNVQIENVVYGRGKARNSARTSVTEIGYAMTRRLGKSMAVAGRVQFPRLCEYPIVRVVIITTHDANRCQELVYEIGRG